MIRRRFTAGLRNLFTLYDGVVDSWQVFDNSEPRGPRLIASRRVGAPAEIVDPTAWKILQEHRP